MYDQKSFGNCNSLTSHMLWGFLMGFQGLESYEHCDA